MNPDNKLPAVFCEVHPSSNEHKAQRSQLQMSVMMHTGCGTMPGQLASRFKAGRVQKGSMCAAQACERADEVSHARSAGHILRYDWSSLA